MWSPSSYTHLLKLCVKIKKNISFSRDLLSNSLRSYIFLMWPCKTIANSRFIQVCAYGFKTRMFKCGICFSYYCDLFVFGIWKCDRFWNADAYFVYKSTEYLENLFGTFCWGRGGGVLLVMKNFFVYILFFDIRLKFVY